MKLIMTFDFGDEERAKIVRFYRENRGAKGLPKLATREILRDFIADAMINQWLAAEDQFMITDNLRDVR